MRLTGKRALVTGSSKGIGAEVARLFAREGARVVISHRPSERHFDSVVNSITKAGGDASAFHADVSDPASVRRLFAEARQRLGGLDILVNAAGLSDSRIWNADIEETTPEMWNRVFSVDAFGTFLCAQAALKVMKKGSIVNVSSTPALAGDTEGMVYAAAKGSVLSLTRMLAKKLAPRIRVNCMAFGSIETGWVEWLDPSQLGSYVSAIPMRRFGKPSEAANLALFLASDESSYITGQAIVLDGGEVMR
ncbi:MAG: 3-oxoacyl-ACP reductase FabG [Thaumarchaeota archaeon]|nr:3-oxoacyl-ACP reductase FabG [Nitrososphaerota archaeon]